MGSVCVCVCVCVCGRIHSTVICTDYMYIIISTLGIKLSGSFSNKQQKLHHKRHNYNM